MLEQAFRLRQVEGGHARDAARVGVHFHVRLPQLLPIRAPEQEGGGPAAAASTPGHDGERVLIQADPTQVYLPEDLGRARVHDDHVGVRSPACQEMEAPGHQRRGGELGDQGMYPASVPVPVKDPAYVPEPGVELHQLYAGTFLRSPQAQHPPPSLEEEGGPAQLGDPTRYLAVGRPHGQDARGIPRPALGVGGVDDVPLEGGWDGPPADGGPPARSRRDPGRKQGCQGEEPRQRPRDRPPPCRLHPCRPRKRHGTDPTASPPRRCASPPAGKS